MRAPGAGRGGGAPGLLTGNALQYGADMHDNARVPWRAHTRPARAGGRFRLRIQGQMATTATRQLASVVPSLIDNDDSDKLRERDADAGIGMRCWPCGQRGGGPPGPTCLSTTQDQGLPPWGAYLVFHARVAWGYANWTLPFTVHGDASR
eukprot:CAMPEP_0185211942 /NCGR_PEP_ID=MMETSP1140-20130426/67278_1 /TAXON_ID=298111 /ORGANISM="Pavlova sp., Strain CCMP459" /LENGTH=149 /DNA_ID=CAMNT_0027779787 /DNA_START=234 /DNA_END=683 /DNA_ORIENTATION=-